MNISVKKITHFGMIYNEVLLTRQTPSGNANRRIFCAAGNNKKVSKRRNRATGRRVTLPPGGSAGFGYVSRMGGQNVGQVEKAERVFWGRQEFSSCCFVQVTRVTASTKSALFLLLRNSGCQITDKYQTATPCRPHYLRRAVKNILRPALPP